MIRRPRAAWLATLMACALLGACSSDDDKGSTPTTQTSSGLSAAYMNNCARCHGVKGEGQGSYPRIPGSKDEAGFIAFVRAGKGLMPGFDASKISDADLRADYLWLTTKR
ncbi:MAG: cytochrome c [Deltaproteobacteria bacterium]|nr:cytochrome c [Deltaproteobacteria bacterium]